jgi:hypothetical protein
LYEYKIGLQLDFLKNFLLYGEEWKRKRKRAERRWVCYLQGNVLSACLLLEVFG